MEQVYLLNYSVKGVKTLDELISLSFYKKTITSKMDTQDYNVKGIYGMNGSGKSGIVNSVEILRNLLVDAGYLSNPIVQQNLNSIINKKTESLFIEVDYVVKLKGRIQYFKYNVTLSKDISREKYIISQEKLLTKNALSKSNRMSLIFDVVDGQIKHLIDEEEEFSRRFLNKTVNLLSMASMSALFFEKILVANKNENHEKQVLFYGLILLSFFGRQLYVYLDESDTHREYVTKNSLKSYMNYAEYISIIDDYLQMKEDYINALSVIENVVPKERYGEFEKNVNKLYEFLHIFKSDLISIEIDKKEDHELWFCELVMNYGEYKIHAEYESTGIKKLIKLYAYLKKMVQGSILFIDEFDSNLHDVYLCALLEYLMEYGEGQLCFTTHNVGPMDILKHHRKSIDFLSENHKIYPWVKSGSYSPANLYRNGMIEGSPFNIDSIDFIGVFNTNEGDR